ncbi:hypothetical protein [Halalkalibacter nanhaiisediminis]|uniref:Uncharacterized protein n=1 Tax=Halalkalibacter nanhaiisediminis TaxID=688079 RepID=A0A562QML2_9BACI|nr:hypothetical protein [Halalkalibacter nanhaiisediminis]TWI57935.1 hypothetical protein IQ10_01265 [Halalkalibacter nanhaiisediminis]
MLPSIAVLIVASTIVYFEVPTLLKKGLKKEVWTFSLLLLLGVMLCIAKETGDTIPSPLSAIKFIYQPIYTVVSTYLE